MTLRRPALRTALLTAVLLAATSACTSTPDAAPEEPDSASDAPTATGAPVTFDREAQVTLPDEDVLRAELTDDLMLTLSPEALVARSLPELEQAWTRSPLGGAFTDLWLDEEAGDLYLLETASFSGEGTEAGSDTFTVHRLDVAEGDVTGTTTVTVPKTTAGSAYPATGRIAGVTGSTVVLDTWVGEQPHRTVAVEEGVEEPAWTSRASQVLLVEDGLAVLSVTPPGGPGRITAREADGDVAWTALEGTTSAALVGVSDGRLTVNRGALEGTTVQRISLETGRTRELRAGMTGEVTCRSDGETGICWAGQPYRVTARDVEDGTLLWRLPTGKRFAPLVTLVEDGRVYGALDTGQGVVLDARTGEDEVEDSGASPVAVGKYGAAVVFAGSAVFVPVAGAEPTETLPSPGG